MEILMVLGAVFIGTLIACFMACLPALHIYNVAGIVIMMVLPIVKANIFPGSVLVAFMMSLVVGYSVLNTIPSIFLGAPDESAVFVTMPGNRALMLGKGYEATLLTGIGSLGGLAFLVLISPLASIVISNLKNAVAPHMHWILGTILAFMVMSEWPKDNPRAKDGWPRLFQAWKSLAAGLVTLILSGILGFILMYRSPMPVHAAFQNIMPAFVGLFAVPWVIQNMMSKTMPPKQHICESLDVTPRLFLRGVGAGCFGGLFAAVFPIVTGGIGGLLAGHATAQRDDRLFIISQGASKVVYYVGAFMLLFVPGLGLTRGGMAWMLSGVYKPMGVADYYMIIAVICVSGALSFLFLGFFTKVIIKLIDKIDYRLVSLFTFIFILGVVTYMVGWQGLIILAVSAGIGMIPVAFHSRRMNCLGVLLIPTTLNMSGYGPVVAGWLGLL